MITRIEIDGFKSFVDFALDLEPFTVLAGANNSGKSNLLEAAMLLRDLQREKSSRPLVERERGTGIELFHRVDDGTLVSEVRIGADVRAGIGAEQWPLAVRIVRSEPGKLLGLDVRPENAEPVLNDLDSWLTLTADPARLREGASLNNKLPLASDGANLAAVMGRISEAKGLAEFVLDAAYVVGDLVDVQSVKDERRNLWDFDLIMRGNRRFTPSLVSDGTLRVLAILAAVHDPDYRGVVMIEELENGLHPQYLGRLCGCLMRAVSHGDGRQVIATTHSTIVVGDVLERSERSVVFLDQVAGPSDKTGERRLAHWTRARRVGTSGERGTYMTQSELAQYLSPAGGQ